MATNNILKDLFAQIIHSEEKVKERTAKLRQVNNEIEDFQARIAETSDEIKSFQGNSVIKSQKIAEQELQLKWFSEKQNILSRQKQDLEAEKNGLQNSLTKIQEKSDRKREKFMEASEQFCSMYDLISDGRKRREINRRKKLQEITEFKEKLRKDLQSTKTEKDEIVELEGRKDRILSEIRELERKHGGMVDLLREKKAMTERMEQEKITVAQRSQSDPEFQRITAELHKSKENSLSLEGVCDEMTQELQELQQQFYQKQLQRQRQQRQVQKQHQQEQWHQQHGQQTNQQMSKQQAWHKQDQSPTSMSQQYAGQHSNQQTSKQQQTAQNLWQKQQESTQQLWQKQLEKEKSKTSTQQPPPKQFRFKNPQEKRVQKPLFDNSQKQASHDFASNADSSLQNATSRSKPQPKNSSFRY